jgi:CarD family transcriptional regulator
MTKKEVKFEIGQSVVYPTHGVGEITAIETQTIGDRVLEMFVIEFKRDKMTLRVPTHRVDAAGLRDISDETSIDKAIKTLKSKAKIARGMWSRRAQEYEAKINSGNIVQIAEVVRDLHKNVDQSERSYSERMIYESALGRLAGEMAAARSADHKETTLHLVDILRQNAA